MQVLSWNSSSTQAKELQKAAAALLKAYMKKDPAFMQGPVGDTTESWIREAVLLTATAAVEASEDLSQQDPTREMYHWQNLIINRIIRGVLWTIHNSNAPGIDPLAEDEFRRSEDRSLECSLSSKWLKRGTNVYIS